MDPASAASSLLGIGSNYLEGSMQQAQQEQQAQDAANLEAAEFGQQVNYINKEEEGLRGALTGIGAQGNPFMQARGDMPGATFATGGTFGPGGSGPSQAVQMPNQVTNPIPKGPGYSGVVSGLTGVVQPGQTGYPSSPTTQNPMVAGLIGGQQAPPPGQRQTQ
jgi:hypothetical protein